MSGRRSRRGRWFFVGTAVVAFAISAAGFGPSIIDQSARRSSPTLLVEIHAVFMVAWLLVYFVQTSLAATGRLARHRRLGLVALPLVAGVVVTGVLATIEMARRGYDLSGDLGRLPGGAMAQTVFQFANLIIFPALVGTAILLRHRPDTHKRLMTLAVIETLMAAPLGHLVGHFGLAILILPAWGVGVLVALIVHDRRSRGRVHPVSLVGGIGLVLLANVEAIVIGPSQGWQRFMEWVTH